MLTLLADRADQQLVAYGEFLQESGYDVIAAEGSESTILEANQAAPDVVLVHLREPVLETLELCRRIRAGALTRRVSIIVLTEIDDVHVRDRIIGAGAAMIVRTPVPYPALFLRVRRMLTAKHRVPRHQRRPSGSLGAYNSPPRRKPSSASGKPSAAAAPGTPFDRCRTPTYSQPIERAEKF